MSTTVPWLVRWCLRDWASCFSVCKLPLDDHKLTSSPRVVKGNMASDKKWKKKELRNQTKKDKDGVVPTENKFDHSSWSLSMDDEYIVFCFREDGALDVVKDEKCVNSEALSKGVHAINKNSKPVNRKLKYGDNEEQVSDAKIHEKRSNANEHRNDQHCVTPHKVVHCHHTSLSLQEEENRVVTQQHRDNRRKACQVEANEEHGVVSAESRNSDQSEANRGSFAFPVLRLEWIGSPVKMPKSEDLHLRKQKARSVRFQCCRF
ncbi:hypothetical protein RJT34_33514 [Clitoria ternatea]|uniref:Protein BREAKING OF ASYMMETRY IN THE STOMATAL LINEAGE n=1 Tax=Clitoria ternatea TaxID=43366 RepID=A0AAN9EXY6_CLITE